MQNLKLKLITTRHRNFKGKLTTLCSKPETTTRHYMLVRGIKSDMSQLFSGQDINYNCYNPLTILSLKEIITLFWGILAKNSYLCTSVGEKSNGAKGI